MKVINKLIVISLIICFNEALSITKTLYFFNETPFAFTITIAGVRAPSEAVNFNSLVPPMEIPEEKFFLKPDDSTPVSFEMEEDNFNLFDEDANYDLSKARLVLTAHTYSIGANPMLSPGKKIRFKKPKLIKPTIIINEIKDGNYIVKYDKRKRQLYLA